SPSPVISISISVVLSTLPPKLPLPEIVKFELPFVVSDVVFDVVFVLESPTPPERLPELEKRMLFSGKLKLFIELG
ncbi:hypothetical protein S1OALGB6SA_963, partial [Olavius algarvensis spirochete endosymbiont]